MDGTYAGVKAVKIGGRQREKRCGGEKEMLASDWLTKGKGESGRWVDHVCILMFSYYAFAEHIESKNIHLNIYKKITIFHFLPRQKRFNKTKLRLLLKSFIVEKEIK